MKRQTIVDLAVFALLVAVGVVTRWISGEFTHLWNSTATLSNFTATGAVSLFAGYYFRHHLVAALVPLALMVASNLALKQYNSVGQMAIVYVALILPVILGVALRGKNNPWRIGGCAVATSVWFYLITNFAYWGWYDLYPKTVDGLLHSYVLAVPFFRNMLAADLFFSALIFGTYTLAVQVGVMPRRMEQTAPAVSS